MAFKMTVASSGNIHVQSAFKYPRADEVRPPKEILTCPRCGKIEHVGNVGGTAHKPRCFCSECNIEFDSKFTYDLLSNGAVFKVGINNNGVEERIHHE